MEISKIFKKELNGLKWRTVVIIGIFVVTFLFIVLGRDFVFSMIPDNLSKISKSPLVRFIYPKDIAKQIILMKKDNMYYLWSQWYGKSFYQFLILSIVIFGFSSFSREIERKTIYFLLAFFDRGTIYIGKILSGIVSLAFVTFIGGMFPVFYHFSIFQAVKITFSAFLVSLFLYSIVIFYSILEADDVKTILYSFATFIVIGFLGFFRTTHLFNIYRYMTGIDIYLHRNMPWIPLFLIFGLSMIFMFLSYKIFKNKEL